LISFLPSFFPPSFLLPSLLPPSRIPPFLTPSLFCQYWGVELRAWCLSGKCLPLEPHPQDPFVFVIFQIGAHFYACTSLDHDPPVYISCRAEMTGTWQTCVSPAFLLVELWSYGIFAYLHPLRLCSTQFSHVNINISLPAL
jgi:hypothetical protein